VRCDLPSGIAQEHESSFGDWRPKDDGGGTSATERLVYQGMDIAVRLTALVVLILFGGPYL
jgi:hypothetical protein